MSQKIKSVAVIGAGTMGAGIAALVANTGLPVLLLDIVPTELTPEEEAAGLSLDDEAVRNRIVEAGLKRAKQARPPAFADAEAEKLVSLGNIENDLDKIAEVDWVVEAIIEKLEPKQALMVRIDALRHPDSIITTNTSGLPIASIAEGRSDSFKRHFLGSHFFNPPRYLKLLEIIPTADTDPTVVDTLATFGQERLDKGVVFCKDTPNFIGNRLFSINNSFAANYALEHGYSIAEADALTGPLLARPRTGTFRLQDLVGIDVTIYVAHNLYDLIPHDPYREVLHSPKLDGLVEAMMSRQWLGNKTGQGFYKKGEDAEGNRVFMTLNPQTMTYDVPAQPHFEAVEAVGAIDEVGARVRALLADEWQGDRAAQFVRDLLTHELSYVASVAPEIAHNLKSIDDAIRWGFAHEVGPFQLWDRLGVAEMVAMIEAAGYTVAPWVTEMLAQGYATFYHPDEAESYYDWDSQQYVNS